jgi:hypothetical protein
MPHNKKRYLHFIANGPSMNEPYAFILVYIYQKEFVIEKHMLFWNILSGYAVLAVDEHKYIQLRC